MQLARFIQVAIDSHLTMSLTVQASSIVAITFIGITVRCHIRQDGATSSLCSGGELFMLCLDAGEDIDEDYRQRENGML